MKLLQLILIRTSGGIAPRFGFHRMMALLPSLSTAALLIWALSTPPFSLSSPLIRSLCLLLTHAD
jgi:hypothetical protein